MRKSAAVLSVVVVLGVAYGGASWYVGKRTQTTLEHAVEQINERLSGPLGADAGGNGTKLTITDYQRHVFSSDVMYTLQVKGAQGEMLEFKLSDHLQHGPMPAGVIKAGDFTPMLALSKAVLVPTSATQAWFDSLGGKQPVAVTTEIGFSGTAHSHWQFEPLNLSDDGDALTTSGGVIDIDFSNDYQNSTTTGRLESLAVTAAQTGETLKVEGIAVRSNTTASDQDQMRTESHLSVDSLLMLSGDDAAIDIKKIVVTLQSLRQDNLLGGVARYDLGQVAVGPNQLGSMSAGIKMDQIDVNALMALVNEYEAIKAAHGVTDDDQSLAPTEAESAVLREKLLALLATDPSVSIAPLSWKNDKGESSLTLDVSLTRPPGQDIGNAAIDALLSQIVKQAKLDLSISKAMFVQAFVQAQNASTGDPSADSDAGANNQQAAAIGALVFDQYAARLQQAGLVQVDGDRTVATITYSDNLFEVNGQKLTTDELIQRLFKAAM